MAKKANEFERILREGRRKPEGNRDLPWIQRIIMRRPSRLLDCRFAIEEGEAPEGLLEKMRNWRFAGEIGR